MDEITRVKMLRKNIQQEQIAMANGTINNFVRSYDGFTAFGTEITRRWAHLKYAILVAVFIHDNSDLTSSIDIVRTADYKKFIEKIIRDMPAIYNEVLHYVNDALNRHNGLPPIDLQKVLNAGVELVFETFAKARRTRFM